MTTNEAAHSISMYNARSSSYDSAGGGWHAELGRDFIKWAKPKPGDAILDLACGTGLVTIPFAAAVGKSGVVTGVDISSGMLEEARKKTADPNSAEIEWIEHDITNLANLKSIQEVFSNRGGFDIISCCSAIVLLPATIPQVIKDWASFLKPDGKLIIDVPTEDKTLQNLFTGDLRHAVGTPMPYDRSWITDIHPLEKLYQEAGLEIEKSFRTKSYLPEKWYDADERDSVFEQQMKTYPNFEKDGIVEQAKEAFGKLWNENLKENGKFWDGHPLYLTIGKKK